MYKFIINEPYKKDVEDFILNLPLNFELSGDIIHDYRNKIKVFNVNGLNINVKWFKLPNIINQFVYAFFRKSKAERSYNYGLELQKREIDTPDPIGYLEYRNLVLFKQSAYISKQEHFDGSLQELRRGEVDNHKDLIVKFAQFTAELHDKQVLHLDYSSGNILYKKDDSEFKFYLVDLNRMIFDRPIDMRMAALNFRRLWGSDEMIDLFVTEYAIIRVFDVEEAKEAVREQRQKFWAYFEKKYPGEKPYYN